MRALLNWPRERLLLAMVAAGFAFLALDTLTEHLGVFAKEPLSVAPPVASTLVALSVGYGALAWTARSRAWAAGALWAALVVGLVGFVVHNGEHLERGIDWSHLPIAPPILAPLGICGLAVFGLLALTRKVRGEQVVPAQG